MKARISTAVFCSLLALAFAHAQTAHAPPDATTVQIDNTKSTSKPDDVQTPEANPARPTFTNPAHIPPVGYLQFEQGFVEARNSPGLGRQFSLSQVTKVAVHPRLMFEFLSQPFAFTTTPTGPYQDVGDLDAAIQVLPVLEHGLTPTIAFAYQHVLRSGSAPNLDVGSSSQSAVLLISGDLGDTHYDTNFVLSEQTGPGPSEADVRRAQAGQMISATRPILSRLAGDRLGLTGELWHVTQPLPTTDLHDLPVARANAVGALFALSYAVAPNFVVDAALNHGLTTTSTQWQFLAGFTYLLPHRMWSQHSNAPRPPARRHHIPHK